MSLGSATDVYGREMQILFGILDAEIDKHVFHPGGIPCVDERGASIRKQLQRKIRDWPGICFFTKRRKNVTFVLCVSASGCFMQPLGNYNTKTGYGTEKDTWYS